MTSRERVRAAVLHQNPDRVPAAFEAVGTVNRKLMEHYGFTDYDQLLEKFEIDVVPVGPRYIGPELPVRKNEKGETVTKSFWGYETTEHVTDLDTYGVTTFFPLNGVESIADVKEKYTFPDPDWFDYASLKEQCDRYPDKALIMGHEGPFQIVTYLIEMDQFFMLMVDEPETAKYIPVSYTHLSHTGIGVEKGIENIIAGLDQAITGEENITVLLETMSGKGTEIGDRFEQLRAIRDGVKHPERIGICLDTCHVFAAGYDIVNDLDGVLEEFDRILGLPLLRAVHLNDSQMPFGSHKDRHAAIGEGLIGWEALLNVLRMSLIHI